MRMDMRRREMLAFTGLATSVAYLLPPRKALAAAANAAPQARLVTHTDAEWRAMLTQQQYAILRGDNTEPAGSSPLISEHRSGLFACAGCRQVAFSSSAKFDSNTGWPSFYQPVPGAVATKPDHKLPVERTEVHCARCASHLGH